MIEIALPATVEGINLRVVERLRYFRSKRNLSQAALASLIGVSRPAYANYESGRNLIPAAIALEASKYLGVSPNDLLMPTTGHTEREKLIGRLTSVVVPIYDRLEKLDDKELYELMASQSKSYFAVVDRLLAMAEKNTTGS